MIQVGAPQNFGVGTKTDGTSLEGTVFWLKRSKSNMSHNDKDFTHGSLIGALALLMSTPTVLKFNKSDSFLCSVNI